jgi:hypothetical protein
MRSILTKAALAAAVLLTVGRPIALVRAGPPPEPQPPQPDTIVVPPVAGFWLSLELIGPRGAQIDVAEAQRVAPIVDALPRGGAPPPGELVGRVDTLEQALAWIEQHAFEGGAVGFDDPSDPGTAAPAPLPGGGLLREHGVHLTALVLTAASSSGGTELYPWPPASVLPTPSSWLPASLAVDRAPMFAAPAPELPPASERYRVVARQDSIWQLGALDRCTPERACLRWAQVLVRQGDRWFGGWLPAALVVADRDWVAGPDERSVALLASHRDRAEVGYVLLERRRDRHEPPRGLTHPHAGATWPAASVQILGEQLTALIANDPVLTLELPPIPTPLERLLDEP